MLKRLLWFVLGLPYRCSQWVADVARTHEALEKQRSYYEWELAKRDAEIATLNKQVEFQANAFESSLAWVDMMTGTFTSREADARRRE